MALTKPKKHTSSGTWVVFCIFPVGDLLKIPCFFIDIVPIVGTAIGLLGGLFISLIQIVVGGLGLYLTGFFAEGPESTANILWFMSICMGDAVPLVDDLPFTTPAIWYRIRKTQKADAKAELEYKKKLAAQHLQQEQERAVKAQAAQAAAQRANANRQRAMQESLDRAA